VVCKKGLYLHMFNTKIEIMDYEKISDIEMGGIDYSDYPDFCDAYIESAEYNGKEMTSEQLDEINDDGDFVYSCVEKFIY
jgi:hypothetical protein